MLKGRRVAGEGSLVEEEEEEEIHLRWWVRNEVCPQEVTMVMTKVAWYVEVQKRYLRGDAAGL